MIHDRKRPLTCIRDPIPDRSWLSTFPNPIHEDKTPTDMTAAVSALNPAEKVSPGDPSSTAYSHQIAGHAGLITPLPEGKLRKVCPKKELEFYQSVSNSERPELDDFKRIIPKFFGGSPQDDKTATIDIENLLPDSLPNPSIADIKIGTRLYGTEADVGKQERMMEQARITTSGATGLRICGMKVWDSAQGTYMVKDRTYGRELKNDQVGMGLKLFLTVPGSPDGKILPLPALESLREKLILIRDTLKRSPVRLYAASVLIIYAQTAAEKYEVHAKLIDFAHSHIEDGPDEGAVLGLTNLVTYLDDIIAEHL
ncbi:hypothetical protein DFS34DRAFT_645817 [Phlyctochytrium arcticum]|nr:hypothetical protein DFS34DRAFT_645817 [Phlyctochytrium arcticum]